MDNLNKRTLSDQTKQVAYNVYSYFKKRKANVRSEEHKRDTNIIKAVAEATGLSMSSITRIVKEGKEIQQANIENDEVIFPEKPKEKHIRKKKISIDTETELLIRNEVIQYYESNKQVPSIRKLNAIIKSKKILQCSNEYLRKLLNELGFTNATETKKDIDETKHDVKVRLNYLQAMKTFREKDKSVFIINDMMFSKEINDKLASPNFESIIVLHLCGSNGFSDKSTMKIKHTGSETKTMKENHIENYKWFEKFVSPLLPRNSVIVFNYPEMKNASDSFEDLPNSSNTRVHIQEWLTKHNITFFQTQTKECLLNIIEVLRNKQNYSLEKILKMKAHEVLHMPSKYTKLNPVSLAIRDGKKIPDILEDTWTEYIDQVKRNEIESYQEDLRFMSTPDYSSVEVKTEIDIDVDIDMNTLGDRQEIKTYESD